LGFSIAHIADPHLGPVPKGAMWQDFRLKRLIGGASWHLRRRKLFSAEVADALVEDVRAMSPDQVAVTGDIVNIAAAAEFPAAAAWLAKFGPADRVSFVPGNHDCYVKASWADGLGRLAPYMTGEMRMAGAVMTEQVAAPFPFVRLRKNVALIGLNTGVPQRLHKAGGTLGTRQLELFGKVLGELREKGYYRCVLIHHPPMPGLNTERKALTDASAFVETVQREGADLVLHGHNHRLMENRIGATPVIGLPSACYAGAGRHEASAWALHTVTREGGAWRTETNIRRWNKAARSFQCERPLV
jgi:3',5'-cyclic AMP phosphodiesterase CpdA